MKDLQEAAAALLGSHNGGLDPRAQKVARHVVARRHVTRDALRDTRWREPIALQQRQIELLTALLRPDGRPG